MTETRASGAARAGAWSAVEILLRQSVQFVVSIVLARLLTPADFGVMALIALFTGFGVAIIEGGLATALIQRQETTREQESALFWVGLAWAAALAALLVLLGPWIARFYGQPVLAPLMWLAAAHAVIVAVAAVPMALLTRTMRFDLLAKIALAAAVVSGGAAVAAAAHGAGVWALGVQLLVFTGLQTAMIWRVARWSPRARLRGTGATQLLRFSGRVGFSGLVEHLYVQGFAVLVGKLHGVSDVGIYNRAHATQYFASGALGMVIRRFALPLFSARAADPDLLRETLRRSARLAMLVTLPVMALLAISSDLVILVLFGPDWSSAAGILSVLAIAGMLWPLQVMNSQLLLAVDRPDLFWRTEVVKKGVGIALIAVGSTFGLVGLAWSQVVFGVFAHLFNGRYSARHAGYGAWAQVRDVAGIAAVCALAFGGAHVLRGLLHLPPSLLLLCQGAVGALLFVTVGSLVRVRGFGEARQMLVRAVGSAA